MALPEVRKRRNLSAAPGVRLALAYPWWRLSIAAFAVLAIAIVAAGLGSVQIPPFAAVQIAAAKLPFYNPVSTWPDSWNTILWDIRLPRVATAGLVGASLAMAGATYQGLFRNPLAEPYLLGIAGGAGLGATVVLTAKVPVHFNGVSVLPIAAFAGALIAGTVSYSIAKRSDGLPLGTLILAGVAVASLTAAVTSLLIIRSSPDVKPLLGWLLGGFIGSQWKHTLMILPYVALGSLVTLSYGRVLNLLQTSEEEAQYMGVNVHRIKLILIGAASLVTAAAVSVGGLIGFVGLIAPHAVRLAWGHDYRTLLPMSIFVGAGFLIVADLVARLAVSPGELPVGVVTAFCGAPFFLYLIRRGGAIS